MISKNKILKAIQEGIDKSLINFNDKIEFNKTNNVQQKIKVNINKEHFLHENFVDLDLPSGKLWAKYNFGASHNNSEASSWYGNYYAWGELKQKTDYSGDSLLYTDNIEDRLPLSNDIIYQTYKQYNCHIPTKDDFDELLTYTTNKDIHNYNDIAGLDGKLFIAKNGISIFIPAAGFYIRNYLISSGEQCYLWEANVSKDDKNKALNFFFNLLNVGLIDITDTSERYYGQPLRGII